MLKWEPQYLKARMWSTISWRRPENFDKMIFDMFTEEVTARANQLQMETVSVSSWQVDMSPNEEENSAIQG